jgi:hypothetical protein
MSGSTPALLAPASNFTANTEKVLVNGLKMSAELRTAYTVAAVLAIEGTLSF